MTNNLKLFLGIKLLLCSPLCRGRITSHSVIDSNNIIIYNTGILLLFLFLLQTGFR